MNPTILELVTSAMRRQGRGFVAVHWGSSTPANNQFRRKCVLRRTSPYTPALVYYWCTGMPREIPWDRMSTV